MSVAIVEASRKFTSVGQTRGHCTKSQHSYWDCSLDAEPENPHSTRIYESAVCGTDKGFGGNCDFIEATLEQKPLNSTGHTGGEKMKISCPPHSCSIFPLANVSALILSLGS
ncbi:hypothetical protein BDU57DRAFT_513609 [Ampelomyces quisqualis]|uniref:Uncharacterized protein n=1 Tax=Ampelomyces quisqualis TaxID=50730 RepID=A0A6A5QTW6_AMPQU|nr:hypothetical protein BDU57DRAFT_513609 [Ampelomyces quisqualis]